jgi:arylformamidase
MIEAGGWIDVTVPIRHGMVCWPGDAGVKVVRVADLERGDDVTVTRLDLGVHTATHIDAPLHFLRGGKAVHELGLGGFLGPARVVALPEARVITREVVEAVRPQAGERLLFHTRNSERCWNTDAFVKDYTYVALDGARALVEAGVVTVGIDYLSVGGGRDSVATHQALLGAGVSIIEGLDLRGVDEGPYELLCLPMQIRGSDGAPARALLRRLG